MGISGWQLLVILIIVLLIFGTKRLRNAGGDLATAIRNFKSEIGGKKKEEDAEKIDVAEKVIEGEATRERDKA